MTAGDDKCRGCGQPIEWVRMASGKWNPLNPDPDPARGNVLVCDDPGLAASHDTHVGRAVALGPDAARHARESGRDVHLSHFATCPARGRFRKSDRKGQGGP